MSKQQDPYSILGVDKYAQDSEIKDAYERLKSDYASDPERLALIEQAYSVLSDIQKRAEYDIKGKVSTGVKSTRKRPSDGIIRARNTLNTVFLTGAAVTAVLYILKMCHCVDNTPIYWVGGTSLIIKVAEYILRLIP